MITVVVEQGPVALGNRDDSRLWSNEFPTRISPAEAGIKLWDEYKKSLARSR